ncbi:mitochondrial import inner membrane translocase subunit tim21 [Cerrena zonata]|uniref:Mitochondrial import inner membrane translocase subunit Tim21 n=1 Tax=Cerrena zonata TaxID=2478898 RepID=A0AAW0FVK5_9APHY
MRPTSIDFSNKVHRLYSTKTAPPPPPPPPSEPSDKNAKELFLPSGDTKTFNKAVKLLEQNELAQKALDFKSGERVKAYGEVPGDRWVRNRPVQSVRSKGKDGNDRLYMKFHVETDSGKHGSVTLEQVDTSFWSSEFSYIALDIPRQRRIYIIEPKYQGLLHNEHGNNGFLGLKWGPKKDN